MQANYMAVAIVIGYMVALGLISSYARRSVTSAHSFTTASGIGASVPAVLVGFLLMSEFIGTAASVGTTQEAFKSGISASWNIIALGVGFLFYAFLLAGNYKNSGQNTISGVFAQVYGHKTKVATSVVMIFALQIVAVSLYAGGGTVLSGLLHVDRNLAIVICGAVAVLYVCMGGMTSVIYTNVIHSVVKYIGVGLALYFGVTSVGGFDQLQAKLPPEMFSWTNVGWSQIFAWFIAGVGATFSTQYVIQAINTVGDARKAQAASFYTAILMVPFGIMAALVGMCAKVMFPEVKSISAFSELIGHMDSLMAGVVAAGLAASLFGTIAAISVSTATLLYKDFYLPLVAGGEESKQSLRFVQIATVVVGLLPIALAIFTPDILKMTFLGKALRASLSVLVLFVFYAPYYGTKLGALISILTSLVVTVGWFLLGNPFGIDNAYVALLVPLVVMTISEIGKRIWGGETASLAALQPSRSATE